MKGQSWAENYWRTAGREFRKLYKQGPGAARAARRFTRLQCNKAMRRVGKDRVREGLDDV